MLKQKRQLFEFFFMIADLFVVSCAWLLAYYLRFMTDLVPQYKGIPEFGLYLSQLLFIWLIYGFIFRRMGLYKAMRGVRRVKEYFLLLQANFLSLLVILAITYLFLEKENPYSRLVFVYFGLLALVFTALERAILRYFLRDIRRRGYNIRYVLIIGAGRLAEEIVMRIRAHPELGIQILGCLSADGKSTKEMEKLTVLGSYANLERMLDALQVDQVIVAFPLEDNHHLPDVMQILTKTLVDIKIAPDLSRIISVG